MKPRRSQLGMALVAVLWAITLLAIMAASFSLTLQRDAGLVRGFQERAKGLALADAGVQYAMLMLSLPDPLKRWQGDGRFYEIALPAGRVRVSCLDEAGKIDINAAQEQTLKSLLFYHLGDQDAATALADAILDWRDPDDLRRLSGSSEAKEYQDAGKGYGPRNMNFQTLEELQMVLGMTPALYKRLEPVLTIFSGQDGINPAKSSREALLALPGMDELTVANYLALREASPPNSPLPLSVPPQGIAIVGGGDIAYTIVAQAIPTEGQPSAVKVVIKRQHSRNGLPFAFQSWNPQIFQPSASYNPSFPQ